MIKKLALVLAVAFFWQCVAAPTAQAQNANPCLVTTTWWFPDAVPLGWFNYSAYAGTFVYVIAAHTIACSHSSGPCPGCGGSSPASPSPSGPSSSTPQVGQPIYLATGDVHIGKRPKLAVRRIMLMEQVLS